MLLINSSYLDVLDASRTLHVLFAGDCECEASVIASAVAAGFELVPGKASTESEIARALAEEQWSVVIAADPRLVPAIRRRDARVPLLVVTRTIPLEAAAAALDGGAADVLDEARLPLLGSILSRVLRERSVELEIAQEIATLGSWTFDFSSGLRRWSAGMQRVFGIAPDAAMDDALERVHEEDRDRLRRVQQNAALAGGNIATEFRYWRGSEERIATAHLRVFHGAEGQPVRLIGVVQDITAFRRAEQELQRRAQQQYAVANLGQLALSAPSVEFLIRQELAAVEVLSGCDLSCVIRVDGGTCILVEGKGFPDDLIGAPIDIGPQSQTMFTIRERVPVVMKDAAAETRFRPAPQYVAQGIVSSVTVPIYSASGAAWGVLGVFSRAKREYAPHEVDFLRSLAAIVGQAADRAASDTAVRRRARQQSAIAELGRLILSSVSREAFDRACLLVKSALDADHAFFAEITPAGTLRRTAGKPWAEGLPVEGPITDPWQSGRAALSGRPVVVDDYDDESRFDVRQFTSAYGIRSGASVPVVGSRRVFGVLSAYSRRVAFFGPGELEFLETVATMLAEAIEREEARDKLEISESRMRRIFDSASEIIFSTDLVGRMTSLNPAFEAITGLSREAFLGKRFDAIVCAEDHELANSLFAQVIAGASPVRAELRIDGRDRRVVVDVVSFAQLEGNTVREIYGFARDVTDERRAEAEQQRLTRSLQLLLESTVEGICTIDNEGRCTMINRAASTLLGYEREELIGKQMHETVHVATDGSPMPLEQCSILAALAGGVAQSDLNETFRRKDGSLLPIAYSAAPIFDDGVRVGAVMTFTDLTERRKLEARLEQAHRLSSLGRLAATVAHEFNNVLMGISPFVEVIRRAGDPSKVAMALDHISNSVKRGRGVTQDILRFTQPAEPSLAPVDVRQWLRGVETESRSILPSHFRIDVTSEPLTILADASQLHQIAMNLVLNARDAMPSGGAITITARKEPADARFAFGAVDEPQKHAHILVRDEGSGMTEETRRHAFEPLFTTKRTGTGLGLAVAHQVVQRHGGDIFIESAPGQGTAFHIFLPLSEQPATREETTQVIAGPAQAVLRVLVVEDDSAVASGLEVTLELEGFEVEHQNTGAGAIAAVRKCPPDLVLLDVGLPDMDGKTVFRELTALHADLPVIFSTGHADRGELELLLERPHTVCLLKPYDTKALLRAIDHVTAVR